MASSTSGTVTTHGDSCGSCDVPCAVVVVVVVLAGERLVVEALLAVEHQEVHAERIERRDEHAGQSPRSSAKPAPGSWLACTASMMLSLE